MFRRVEAKLNLPQLEERILRFWEERDIFRRSVDQRRDGQLFMLYEGPPTVNASPGIHHVLARVFKDVFPRYKAMKGYYAPRKAGWDTHGLPVELEVEEEMGFSAKPDIERYGVEQFNQRCRESVSQHIREWEKLTRRIGFWIDLEHPYVTFDNEYIETCWWMLRQLWDQGLIYQGYKVTPYCPRCGTSLSSHEVALGYKDDTPDPSIYIKFKLASRSPARGRPEIYHRLYSPDKPTYFLAWTTTPWTLPGNTALAVAPEADYVLAETQDAAGRGERLILASARVAESLEGDYEISEQVSGEELVGLEYEPLYPPGKFGVPVKRLSRDYKVTVSPGPEGSPEAYPVIGGDFVSLEEGTGIVHIAPAFGDVDLEAGKENGLFLVQPVDLQGKLTGTYSFAGLFVKEADKPILEELRSRGLLYRSETIRHTYPFCWRCDTPLLYYAKPSWYIKTTARKQRLIGCNQEVNWHPEHIKYGRFGDWLENNVDWAFSRERYWGTPLPLWHCEGCGHIICAGSRKELRQMVHKEAMEEAGYKLEECLQDLHRPGVDRIILRCPKCGGRMRRLPEVIDCWFDSGAMPLAQWHYPFENQTLLEDGRFPADFVCEAVDQTRGWFYSLHALSVLLLDRPCFKNVLSLGHILDAEGEKMSKSRGNVVDPWEVIDRYGADALRWYLFTASPPGTARRFSSQGVLESLRRSLLTLWNTYSFFVIYANIDKFDPRQAKGLKYRSELDRWISSELNQLILDVSRLLDEYDATGAGRKIQGFVDKLSNWYVRRSRRRFWKSENDEDKLAAHATLYECLVTLSKLLAPLTPFLAEEIYQNLVRSVYPEAPESVHLCDFPLADLSRIDERLAQDIGLVMRAVSLGRAARAKAGIKVRQPLEVAMVQLRSPGEMKRLKQLKSQIAEELNVKEVTFTTDPEKLGRDGFSVVGEGGYQVGVAIEITPELAGEGMVREMVHRLQLMRRSAGFNIADYIETYYQGSPQVRGVVDKFAAYIKGETLSRKLILGQPPEGAWVEKCRLGGEEVTLGVVKSGR